MDALTCVTVVEDEVSYKKAHLCHARLPTKLYNTTYDLFNMKLVFLLASLAALTASHPAAEEVEVAVVVANALQSRAVGSSCRLPSVRTMAPLGRILYCNIDQVSDAIAGSDRNMPSNLQLRCRVLSWILP